MKKARNILLIITILGYTVLIQVVFNSDNYSWVHAKKNGVHGTMSRSGDSSHQTSDIELEPIYIELNKGMDPTPIPKFPPQIVTGERTEKWNDKEDGFYKAD